MIRPDTVEKLGRKFGFLERSAKYFQSFRRPTQLSRLSVDFDAVSSPSLLAHFVHEPASTASEIKHGAWRVEIWVVGGDVISQDFLEKLLPFLLAKVVLISVIVSRI